MAFKRSIKNNSMAKKKESVLTQSKDTQYVRGITADGKSVKILKADLADVLANIMRTQTIIQNGLMPSGFRTSLSLNSQEVLKIIIAYKAKTHYATLLATGHYGNPSIYVLNLGMFGGNPAGHPYSLKITRISGPASIVSGLAFVRNEKNCIELTFSSSIKYSAVSAIDFKAGLELISCEASKLYNQQTDALMIKGLVE